MKYRTLVADPPWEYPEGFMGFNRNPGKWSRRIEKSLPYPSMSEKALEQLPIADLAEPNAAFFCWATNRHFPLAMKLIPRWGFEYRQTIVWHKPGGWRPGSVAPNHAEFFIVARRGAHRWLGRLDSSVVTVPQLKEHSRKPDVFLDLVEQISPGPYLELFARRQRLGWDTWGDEALNHVDLGVARLSAADDRSAEAESA